MSILITVIKIIITIFIVFMLANIINKAERYYKKKSLMGHSFNKDYKSLSLVVISLYNNDKPYNFIIDTGSTYSVIDKKALEEENLEFEEIDKKGSIYGMDGKTIPVDYIEMNLKYDDNTLYYETFQIVEMGGFNNIKETDGIKVIGILGNSFLSRYKFKINYDGNCIEFLKVKKVLKSSEITK